MRELTVVGLDVDGKHVICEGRQPGERFLLRVDDRLRSAARGEAVRGRQAEIDIEITNVLSAKEIQARIRAGASIEQVAEAAGVEVARVERFAHPVLLERSRAAELATAAHPVLADGPSVQTLLETVATSLVAQGLDHNATSAARSSGHRRSATRPTTWRRDRGLGRPARLRPFPAGSGPRGRRPTPGGRTGGSG